MHKTTKWLAVFFVSGTLFACAESEKEQVAEIQPQIEKEPHVGMQVWEDTCRVCHSVGLAGSPKFGDAVAWNKRLEKRTMDEIYQHALEGWGDMPARGGNPELSDQQVKDAVDYMISQVR